MTKIRRRHNGTFKTMVVMEAICGQKTVSETAFGYGSSSKSDYNLEESAHGAIAGSLLQRRVQ